MEPPLSLAWLIWGLSALFYLAGFFQRVAPAVMTAELMRDFQISATGLGHLSGLYFYSYVAMQIPTGILADTLGPRKLLTIGCMIISFAFVTESVPLSLSGTVSGLTNMGVMMGPMLLQPVVGKILDINWAGQMVDGARFYPVEAYEYGFIPVIGWVCLSVGLLFFTKETNCRQIS